MNQNIQEDKNERLLIRTRQNNAQIFGRFYIQQNDERTNIYKTRNVVNLFKSDIIKLNVYHISCFISVCPFVALSKAKFAENFYFIFFV